MQYLTGLLAFVAVMTLLSTIVAVIIEAFIGIFRLRARGINQILQNYYTNAVEPRMASAVGMQGGGPSDPSTRKDAQTFAKQMLENPVHVGGAKLGAGRFKKLTTRQLIEQMASTDAGRTMLELEDEKLKPELDALAYEFDRYNDAARNFFTQRTKTVSTFIAIVMAFAFNIDALNLYRGLSSNPEAQAIALSWMESTDQQQLSFLTSDSFEAYLEELPEEQAADASVANLRANISELNAMMINLGDLNLPIGLTQFPYCSDVSFINGRVDSTSSKFDPRCTTIVSERRKLEANGQAGLTAGASNWVKLAFMRLEGETFFETAKWIVFTLVAGGMIGLGAPFWYGVYERLAALVPMAGVASALSNTARPKQTEAQMATVPLGRREDDKVSEPNELVFVMRASSGGSPNRTSQSISSSPGPTPAEAMIGGKVSDGSVQRVSGSNTAPNSPATPRMRKLRS